MNSVLPSGFWHKASLPILLTAFGIVGFPVLGWMLITRYETNGTSGHLGFVFGVLAILLGGAGALLVGLPIGLLAGVPLWITLPTSYYLTLLGAITYLVPSES